MQVMAIGKNAIHKLILPEKPLENYEMYDDNNNKLFSINAINDQWEIISDYNTQIISLSNIDLTDFKLKNDKLEKIDRISLSVYSFYGIKIKKSNELFILYCLPVNEIWKQFDILDSNQIKIGKGQKSHILYDNNMIANNHATIYFKDNNCFVINNDDNARTYLNNKLIKNKPQKLENGDTIFIMGLKIIILGKSIFLNNPLKKVKYRNEILKVHKEEIYREISSEEDDDEPIELYLPDEYFYRIPRLMEKKEDIKIKIEDPPAKRSKDEIPQWLTIASTLSMGLFSLISIISTISGITSGNSTVGNSIISIITSAIMLFSMLLIPLLTLKYQTKRNKQYEEKRQNYYSKYLKDKKKEMQNIINKKREILLDNYLSTEKCVKVILEKNKRLWERRIEDDDFLSISLGKGKDQLDLGITYNEDKFKTEEDNLVDMVEDVREQVKQIENVPIVVSFSKEKILAFMDKNKKDMINFIEQTLIQLMAFHTYEDLKFVIFLKDNTKKIFDYMKMLPYVWDNSKEIRFFADNSDEMVEISTYLENQIKERQKQENKGKKQPHYLIITDDYRKIENLKFIEEFLKTKENLGFSMLCIADSLSKVPNECETFIEVDGTKGRTFKREISTQNYREFLFENKKIEEWNEIIKTLSNIPIKYTVTAENKLPEHYNFLEMYNTGNVEQLRIRDRWKNNDSTLSLAAPIGIDGYGKKIVLDIHEKYHGPHGIIAGSTGSGKSEFIITYILSLALNYHPDDVSLLLIDYKGGGLTGAFQKGEVKLPHIAGTITNIDKAGLTRSIVSIQSELRRRQILFNEAREKTNEGTIDIYKYQKLYHEGIIKKPIPHLLIICDEFAELKQQQSDFMSELVSVSRIGRSLGVHLILATQKPSGIIDEQIRGNSKFSICLKVQDKSDSTDVIDRDDAAYLKQSGRFYMKVGNDEYFTLGQSGWSGAQYIPTQTNQKEQDDSIQFISSIGKVIKQIDNLNKKTAKAEGEQLTTIVNQIYKIAKEDKINTQPLWLEKIPSTIFQQDIKNKYNIKYNKNEFKITIGEYDDPYNQQQGPVILDLQQNGNIVIYGNAESGKETLIGTMIYDSITNYTPQEVGIYILDFGSEALKLFKNSPHVGDIMFINDSEKINRFFTMMKEEFKNRKTILADYNGDYNFYIKSTGEKMPLIITIINSYEIFSGKYLDEYDELLLNLAREGVKYGIYFIVTASTTNDFRYRMAQNFKQKIALLLNDDSEYVNIFSNSVKKEIERVFGRGLVEIDRNVYEFQSTRICNAEDYNEYVKNTIQELNEKINFITPEIKILPQVLKKEDVQEYLGNICTVPIGVKNKDLSTVLYDFKNNFATVMVSLSTEDVYQYINGLYEIMPKTAGTEFFILDYEKNAALEKDNKKDNYKKLIKKLKEKQNNHTCVIIIGVGKLINSLDDEEDEFERMLNSAENKGNYSFIICDEMSKIKDHTHDDWYNNYVDENSIIWIGDGISEQYILDVNASRKETLNNCGCSFGYININRSTTLIKLLEMKEKNDDDE